MSSVYIVIGINRENISVCEVFAGSKQAFITASHIAKTLDRKYDSSKNKESDFKPEQLIDGAIRWSVSQTTSSAVEVIFSSIVDNRSYNLMNIRSKMDQLNPDSISIYHDKFDKREKLPKLDEIKNPSKKIFSSDPSTWSKLPLPDYHNMTRDIPAGFSLSDKPLFNQDMVSDAYSFKSAVYDLTLQQQWALVIARVSAIKDYSYKHLSQQEVIKELKARSAIGIDILFAECEDLDSLVDEFKEENDFKILIDTNQQT